MKDIFIFLSLYANDFIFEPGIVSDDGLMPATEWWSNILNSYSLLLHLAFYLYCLKW